MEISVIMPIYNAQGYLKKSVNSVLNQSFTDFELILVNDGSTDMSLMLCKAFAAKDKRVRVIDLPHGGVSAAKSAGIAEAKGNYIALVDADDWVEKDFLGHLYSSAVEANADVTVCRTYMEYSDASVPMAIPIETGVYSGEENEKLKHSVLLCTDNKKYICALAPLWDKLYKSEIIKNNLKYMDKRLTIGEENILTTACMLDSSCICVTEHFDYHYIKRGKSIMHSAHDDFENKLLVLKNTMVNICVDKGYEDLIKKTDVVINAIKLKFSEN